MESYVNADVPVQMYPNQDYSSVLGDDSTAMLGDGQSPDNPNDPKTNYIKWSTGDKWAIAFYMIMMSIALAAAIASVVLLYTGQRNYNDIKSKIKTAQNLVDEASTLDSECFECLDNTRQNPRNGNLENVPGDRTMLIKAQMQLSKESARKIQFPGGIQMPGIVFGAIPVTGFNDPVIVTRGGLTNATTGGGTSTFFGSPGYTSLAYVSTSSADVTARCQSLQSPPMQASNGVIAVSQVPIYIVQSASPSPVKYFACMCTQNIDPVSPTAADSERCIELSYNP
jgi:hypothetical protein